MTDELSIPGGKKSFLPDSDRCPVLFLALLTYVSPKLWRIQIEVFYQYTAWSLPLDLEECENATLKNENKQSYWKKSETLEKRDLQGTEIEKETFKELLQKNNWDKSHELFYYFL